MQTSAPIRFQADENFSHWIVKGVLRRQPLIDFQTATAADLRGLPDPQVLARAAADSCILVTHDVSTMSVHFGAFLASGQHSPGLILIHDSLPIARAIGDLVLIWEASSPEEWRDRLTYLPL